MGLIYKNGIPYAGGGVPEVDSALSGTSENAVQNKIIYNALEDKADLAWTDAEASITFDFSGGSTATATGPLFKTGAALTTTEADDETLTETWNGQSVTFMNSWDGTAVLTYYAIRDEYELTDSDNIFNGGTATITGIARMKKVVPEQLPKAYDDTALAARVTALETEISAVEALFATI